MAVKIRLKQTGKRNRKSYRVVAVDESKKRDGRVIEELGIIDPHAGNSKVNLKQDRIDYWVKLGAQITPAVAKFIKSP